MQNNKSKIVLFDDGQVDSTAGKNILGIFFDVYPVPTAAGFFEILEKVTPDLILLDMELPELNANKTMQKIKADSRFADIPVILLSPQNETYEQEGFKLGAVDCIAKPFSSPFFLKRIVKQLLIAQKDKVTRSGGNTAAKVM